MTTEQRLAAALRHTAGLAPSEDLWSRVLYSIEEDKAHRRRIRLVVFVVVAVLTAAVIAAAFAVTNGGGKRIDWVAIEALETVVLVTLTAALGPAIRRFGRDFASELLHSEDRGARLLRMLDIAYYLVFAGYVLLTARLEAPAAYAEHMIGVQIFEAAARVGGLFLIMGVLHAATMMALPLVALVKNSTDAGAKLPRWVAWLLVAAAIGVGFLLAWTSIGITLGD